MKIRELFELSQVNESLYTQIKLMYRNFVDSKKSLFHISSSYNAMSIIKDNAIYGSYKSHAAHEPKSIMKRYKGYVSLSTRRHNTFNTTTIAGTDIPYHVLFEFDAKKIINDFESMNVDFWSEVAREHGITSFDQLLSNEMNEHELRIFVGRKGISPLSTYIKGISVLIHTNTLSKKDTKDLESIKKKFPTKFFYSYTDFVTGMNGLGDLI